METIIHPPAPRENDSEKKGKTAPAQIIFPVPYFEDMENFKPFPVSLN